MAMHLPGDTIPRELRPEPGTDGTVHSIAYAGFAFLLCRTFDAWHRRKYPTVNPPLLFYVFIFISCITYAYIDEETQPLTGRSADPADWQADVFGAAFGCCCDLFLTIFLGRTPQGLKKRRRRRHRHRHRTRSESGEHRHRRRRRSNSRPSELPEVRPEEPNEGLDPGLA
ncbi:MAG: VanZ family protein [Planctomycetia bacterium]|nr:VanZ family protein [Planctomycetia bacterium]